jgi:8-amino-7-oxononanoate synthase
LEDKIAAFKGVESALIFNSGYMANLGIITALCGPNDLILSDRLNHASIIDASMLSRAILKRYRHLDLAHLEELLIKETDYRRRVIVSEAVFSMEGDILPLNPLLKLADKYGATVILDEAHALGVLGDFGRGVEEYYKADNAPHLIRMATMGKALGSFGAFVAGDQYITEYLVNRQVICRGRTTFSEKRCLLCPVLTQVRSPYPLWMGRS